jgi:hypothetical protein
MNVSDLDPADLLDFADAWRALWDVDRAIVRAALDDYTDVTLEPEGLMRVRDAFIRVGDLGGPVVAVLDDAIKCAMDRAVDREIANGWPNARAIRMTCHNALTGGDDVDD